MRLLRRPVLPSALILVALTSWLVLPSPSIQQIPHSEIDQTCGKGRLEERDGLRILRLKGTPYEMGYQHGVLLHDELRAALQSAIYEELVLGSPICHFLLLRHARHVHSYVPLEYREEMRGLADGANIAYLDILVLNSHRDFVTQLKSGLRLGGLLLRLDPPFIPPWGPSGALSSRTATSEGASRGTGGAYPRGWTLAAFGSATRDGGLLQSLDLSSALLSPEELLLIVYEPKGGNSLAAVTWPGAVGVTIGLNEEKISVTALPVLSQDASLDGIPLPILLRDVLQYAGDIPTAERLLASATRTTGHNVIVGDGKPADAQAIELSAHLYAVFEAENDLVIRTNQYLDPALSRTQDTSAQDEHAPNQALVEALAEAVNSQSGRLDLRSVTNLLVERRRARGQDHAPGEGESVLGVVIASSDLEMWVILGGSTEGDIRRMGLRLQEGQ